MDTLSEMLPLLIPILLVDLTLAAAAVTHILRHPQVRFGTKAMWLAVAVLLLFFGPVLYFAFGRGEGK